MASIASVWVEVVPETAKIASGIEKALCEVDDDVRAVAKRWRESLCPVISLRAGSSRSIASRWASGRKPRADMTAVHS